jgi:two-component system response regulator FixJ
MENQEKEHIVFVDDEPRVCDAVRKTLERAGMNVRCFHSADDCLVGLAEERCDLLITDVKMPGKDGIELLVALKEQQPWIPVLVVTGYGDVPMAVRALKAGAVDFIEKPLDRDVFLATVRAILAQHASQRSLFDHNLTRTETKVLYFLLEGKNNREIADALHRSPRTIEVHRGHLMRKMGANNVVELLRRAAEIGLFGPHMKYGEDARVC